MHLKDEVCRLPWLHLSINTMLTGYSGISTASSSRRRNSGPRLEVETYGHREQTGIIAESDRFCIAPLDVLKIRLQLQIYPLPDPSSSGDKARVAQYGIGDTFKSIVRNEGIRVGPDQSVRSAA